MWYTVVDCEWNEYGEWSECSAKCGVGEQTRTRTVKQEAESGGNLCSGPKEESKDCEIKKCPGMH